MPAFSAVTETNHCGAVTSDPSGSDLPDSGRHKKVTSVRRIVPKTGTNRSTSRWRMNAARCSGPYFPSARTIAVCTSESDQVKCDLIAAVRIDIDSEFTYWPLNVPLSINPSADLTLIKPSKMG